MDSTEVERIALDLAYDYTARPVNFGTDSELLRAGERDAFVEGFAAGVRHMEAIA